MEGATAENQLGPYTLVQLLAEGELTQTFLAEDADEQMVLIDWLSPDISKHKDARSSFLTDAKRKEIVTHPLFAKVYYTSSEHPFVFFSYEHLRGPNLAEFVEGGETPFTPTQTESLLRHFAKGMAELEERNVGTLPVSLEDIYLPRIEEPHVRNLVIDGDWSTETRGADQKLLARALNQLTQRAGRSSVVLDSALVLLSQNRPWSEVVIALDTPAESRSRLPLVLLVLLVLGTIALAVFLAVAKPETTGTVGEGTILQTDPFRQTAASSSFI